VGKGVFVKERGEGLISIMERDVILRGEGLGGGRGGSELRKSLGGLRAEFNTRSH